MTKGIVYVGGSSRHLMDQSAEIVADRIARSIQCQLQDGDSFSYRVHVDRDVHRLAPDISLDIASIEITSDGKWKRVIDVLEVNYLSRFIKSFAQLPPLARVFRALWLIIRSTITRVCEQNRARSAGMRNFKGALLPRDLMQATWLTIVTLVTIGSVVFWLVVGLTAVFGIPSFFSLEFDDLIRIFRDESKVDVQSPVILSVSLLLIIARVFRKVVIDPLDQLAVEVFAFTDYQLDDRRFLATPNAILDAIDFAANRGYATVDLLSLSMGAVLSTDAIFARGFRKSKGSQPLVIENWITLGYPYDLIRWSYPRYFDRRQPPIIDIRGHWINVAIQDDFLGTTFDKDEEGRGIRVTNHQDVYMPDINTLFEPASRWKRGGKKDFVIPLRRVVNHRIYWDDEDARAPTCFDAFVGEELTGWSTEFLKRLGT